MISRLRIHDPANQSIHSIYTEPDCEFVNPIERSQGSTINSFAQMERDVLQLRFPGIPIPRKIDDLIVKRAEKSWKKILQRVMATKIPHELFQLLETTSKKEQEALLRGLKFSSDQFIAFIYKAFLDHRFTFSQYTAEFSQKGIKEGDLPLIAYVEDEKLEIVGNSPLSEGQLKQAIQHRKRTISKFFDRGTVWHCFFITYKSLRGEERWREGQPHYHYISDKFGLERSDVINQLKSESYKLSSLPHIDLLGYPRT